MIPKLQVIFISLYLYGIIGFYSTLCHGQSQAGLENVAKILREHRQKLIVSSQLRTKFYERKSTKVINDAGDAIYSTHAGNCDCEDEDLWGTDIDDLKIKTDIFGDGGPMFKDGKLNIGDDRRMCIESDLACQSNGTFWCENRDGSLSLAGSGVVVTGEVIWDATKNDFRFEKWKSPQAGQLRFISALHNFTIKSDGSTRMDPKTCFFYPVGNEPSHTENTFNVEKQKLRVNEKDYRLKMVFKQHPDASLLDIAQNLKHDWVWGYLEGALSIKGSAIINMDPQMLEELANRGAKIKQYGFNAERNHRTITVTSENTGIHAYKPGRRDFGRDEVIQDCNDTHKGASGGSGTIRVQVNGQWQEAVYGLRLGSTSQRLGSVCNPDIDINGRTNTNTARLIRGEFYDSLKSSVKPN